MARRGYVGGDDYSDIAALIAARNQRQQEDPRLGMAMKLMQFGMGQEQEAAQEARLQRASEAQNALERDRLAQETRRVDLAERGAEEAKTDAKTKAIQESMNRGEDVGYRERVFQAGEEEKGAERQRKEQEAALGTFEKAVDKGLITPGTPLWAEWSKDVDPKAVARLERVKNLEGEQTYQKNLKAYKALTPKQRKALDQPGSEAKIEELGGPEIYQRMLAETQQAQPKPNLTPTTTTPPPPTQPYGMPQQQPEAPAYRYGTGTQIIPATGGITGPVTVPKPVTEGPTPAPLYSEPYANEADIANRINADPRFHGNVEDIWMENLKNWWNQPSATSQAQPQAEVAPQAPVAPYEMPRGQQVVNPEVYMPRTSAPDIPASAPSQGQPGFMDWLMNLIKEKSDQRDLPYTYGNVLPPSQPLPTPVQQRGDIYDILR